MAIAVSLRREKRPRSGDRVNSRGLWKNPDNGYISVSYFQVHVWDELCTIV